MAKKKRDPVEESLAQLERDRVRAQKDPRIGQLVKAARKGNAKRVAELLADGADPNAPEVTEWSWDPPILAAVRGRSPEVVRLLAKAGANLNVGFPFTALGQAIEVNDRELVRALIEGGADVNATPENGQDTPLDIAISENRPEMVGMLLDAGADPHLVPRRSKNARRGSSPLQRATDPGRKALLAEFVKRGLVAGKGSSSLLLCAAATHGDLAEAKRLVEGGAKVDSANAQGERPLAVAAIHGRLNIVKFLLRSGANPNARSRIHTAKDTPLIAAVLSGKLPVVEAIVAAGGMSGFDDALMYAKHERLGKITTYLLGLKDKAPASEKKARPPRTGVPTFDLNDACLLVDGPVEAVARAFADHVGAKTLQPDVHGQTVTLAAASWAVFRQVGQPWSVVMRLSGANPYEHLKTAAVRELSKKLKTRAMLVSFGDTSGIYQYLTFDKGKPVELFDTGSADDDKDLDSVAKQFIAAYDVDPRDLPGFHVGRGYAFGSSLRKLKPADVKNTLEFINDHLTRENAFVPFFEPTDHARGQRYELTIEGVGPDDVERLDYVALSKR
jgi:ankyrin repeat protein